jgi:hypothetical protein
MADFSPQITQGSSLRGESFIRAPVEAISGQSLNQVADAASGIYQSVKFNKLNKDVAATESQFLDDFQTGKDIKNLQDQMGSTPTEDAAYQKLSGQIQTLQESLQGRRIDPTEAMTRIEKLKRQALNHAPSYAAQIRNIGSGGSGSEFDTTTKQLIKEENDSRDYIKSMGLDPDIASHRDIAQKKKMEEAELQMDQTNQNLTPFKKAKYISNAVNTQIATLDAIINKQIDDAGGNILNMSNQDRQGAVTLLQGFTNGRESLVVKQMVDADPNISYEELPPDTITKMEQQVKGAAEAKIAQMDGSVPKLLSDNELTYQSNEVMLKIQREDPILFNYLSAVQKAPPGAISSLDLDNMAGDRLMNYVLDKNKSHFSDTTLQSMKSSGIENPEQIHKQYAKNLKEAREFILNNADKVDPRFVLHHTKAVIGDMQSAIEYPKGYLPAEMDEIVNHLSSTEFDSIIAKQDQTTYNEFKEKSGRFLEVYASENMVPDINIQLDKKVNTDTFGGLLSEVASKISFGQVGHRGSLRDLLSITINPNSGTLQFIPNTGLRSVSDEMLAQREARRLTEMYSARSTSIIKAAQNVVKGSQNASQLTPATISYSLFSDALQAVGEPITASARPADAPDQTPAEKAKEVIVNDISQRANRVSMPGPFGM